MHDSKLLSQWTDKRMCVRRELLESIIARPYANKNSMPPMCYGRFISKSIEAVLQFQNTHIDITFTPSVATLSWSP